MSTAMTLKSDCGCGGCGCSGNCGCGGGGSVGKQARGTAPIICTDESFHRPRFFPNQLLTHDSLQGLVDYVVGKNRMHNRFLFGEGVVCGLTVTCHPCDGGKVVVAPGYALDCCGNDIAVPCPEELDIRALIRDLRKRQLAGYDCGDPCEKEENGLESYGLYLVYDEVPVDPVAPYNTGEPCGQQTCEPSQICEGYRFELRCDCKGPDRVDVFDRIKACIGDLREATAAFAKAQNAEVQASRMIGASQIVASGEPIAFDADSITILRDNAAALKTLNALSIDDLDEGDPRAVPEEKAFRLNIAQTQLLTGALTRFRALPEADRKALVGENDELAEAVDAATTALRNATPRIEAFAPRVLRTNAARIEADETVRLSNRFALAEDLDQVVLEGDQARFVALNTQVSARQSIAQQQVATQLKAWLLDKLANSTSLTRCDLYERLKRIRLDDVPSTDAAGISAASGAVIEIVEILLAYLIDCICLALNPPCQPCDDKGVLLACLKVKECEVVDICNLSRSFVLSPVALRYWLPPIGVIGDLLERLCCEFDPRLRRPKQPPVQQIPEFISVDASAMPIVASFAPSISEAEIDENAALALREFNIAPEDVGTISAFASNLGMLSLRAANVSSPVVANFDRTLLDRVLRNRSAPVIDVPDLEDDIRKIVETEVDTLRRSSETVLGAAIADRLDTSLADVRKDVESTVSAALAPTLEKKLAADMTAAITKQLSSAGFSDAVKNNTTVKSLAAENRKLKDDLKKLIATVAKLEKEAKE